MKNICYLLFALVTLSSYAQTPITASLSYQGYDETQAYFGEGEYEIRLDNVDGILDKPVILIDGFDPGDTRNLQALYSLLDIGNQNLADILRNEGYDYIGLNAPQYTTSGKDIDGGGDYIQRNAMVLVALINEINNQKVGNEELVIIGPSMGGLIARYALRYMEENGMDHQTRLFISFDSPHLGANIPISLQYLINYFAKAQNNEDAQLIVDNLLNCPAAKEMIRDHYLSHLLEGSEYEQDPTILLPAGAPNFRDAFQAELDNLGFPQDVRNVAIVNGSGDGILIGIPGAQIVDTNLELGAEITADIILHFTPEAGETITVTDFIGYFNGIPLLAYDADSEAFSYTSGLDSTPGGMSSISGSLGGSTNPVIIDLIDALEQDEYSFIPTYSALAISTENDWYEIPNLEDSPFVNVYIPSENEHHVTLTNQNVAFAISEILQEPLGVIDNTIASFSLIKNPVAEQIILKRNSDYNIENVQLSIYNTSGQNVISKKVQNPSEEIRINHTLQSGIYFLTIKDSKTVTTLKFIVL